MIQLALAAALLFQQPDTVRIFDTPATEALVVRAIQNLGEIPPELRDYEARVHSTLQLSITADTLGVADLPASIDEVVSRVRWERHGSLQQEVVGHRMRVLVPLPYTLATIFERPWVLPHLYGLRIYTPLGGGAAINPFGASGPRHYSYQAGDTIRIRLPDEILTLVAIDVRPRGGANRNEDQLLVGTFYLDLDRAAVARARIGFLGQDRFFPRTFGQVETFLEVENGLWDGRFWLPFRQRRDIFFDSRILGGAVTARVVNRFEDLALNTGWLPSGTITRLDWDLEPEAIAFRDWRTPLGDEESRLAASDFADLRLATSSAGPLEDGARVQFHYDRGNHLFRFNRVEGLFLGAAGRLLPPDPRRDRWEVYGTAGWAFAEETMRGELSFRRGTAVSPRATLGTDLGFEATAYRRLREIQPFRPTFMWDWFYTLPALLWGSDPRDYYDAAGVELSGIARRSRWSGRGTVRVERHDSVEVHTDRFLFGTSSDFKRLAGVTPGTLVGFEAGTQYALGPGSFGLGSSLLARGEAELGQGDFHYQRLTGLLSFRYGLGPITLAARGDGGVAWGSPPPQKLFRFGSIEGLRGYEPNEFGGSSALLGRARLLVGLPPRSARPLARAGLFLIPPLRPNLVFLAESGWTSIEPDLVGALERLGSRPTEGFRSSLGIGISFFDDAVTLERLQPQEDDRAPRWYFGLTYWY